MLRNKTNQNGSVFVYILLGIALLAALFFTFSKQSGNSNNMAGKGKEKLLASELIETGKGFEVAVQKLLSKGCSENEISFENSIVTGYANANSPSSGDKRCWLFDPAGANLRWQKPSAGANNGTNFIFSGNNSLYGSQGNPYGNSGGCTSLKPFCIDLLMLTRKVPLNVCNEINKQLGLTDYTSDIPTEQDAINFTLFLGVFTFSAAVEPYNGAILAKAYPAFCYKYSSTEYMYIHTLVLR